MSTNYSRRQFLRNGSLGLSGILASSSLLKAASLKNEVRLGIIGVGQRGLGLITVLQKVQHVKLAACCDINPGNLQKALSVVDGKTKSYSDFRQLLRDKSLDAVIIATPLYNHYDIAVEAIKENKHVYVEKTMTYDINQAIDLERKVLNKPDLVFQVGHQYHYYDMYPKVKKLIADGIIGTVTHFECQYNRNADWRRPVSDPAKEKQVNWRMYKELSGGPLAELSAHQIDIVNWLQDAAPLSVVGMGDVNFWKDGRTTFDNIRVIYEYPQGVKSSVVSILSNEYNGYQTRILGDKGTIELTRDRATLYKERRFKKLATIDGVTGASQEALDNGKGILIYKDEIKTEPTAFALQDYVDCIRQGKKPISNVTTGKETAIAVHMGNKAAETGVRQTLQSIYTQNK